VLLQEASEEHTKTLQAAEAKAAKAEEGRKQAIQGCKRSEVRILRHCQTQLHAQSCTCEEIKHGSTDFAAHLRQVSNVNNQVQPKPFFLAKGLMYGSPVFEHAPGALLDAQEMQGHAATRTQ